MMTCTRKKGATAEQRFIIVSYFPIEHDFFLFNTDRNHFEIVSFLFSYFPLNKVLSFISFFIDFFVETHELFKKENLSKVVYYSRRS